MTAPGPGPAPDRHFRPLDADGVREVVAWAAAEGQPLEVIGTGSKRALGRPVQAAHVLDLSAISGVEAYEPAELVITAKAATPLAEVEALLAGADQEFAFEPMDYGPLLGLEPGRGTLGGMLATNLSGPKRLKHGAARDHVLGIHAVSGRGEIFKSGGTVVKNVTGYDLSRGLAGSWGTLAVTTSLSLKVLPAPQTEASVLIEGLEDDEAADALCRAMGTSAEASSAAHLPQGIGSRLAVDGLSLDRPATLIRLEGFAPSVDYRFEALAHLMKPLGPVTRLEAEPSRALWRAVRDVRPFCSDAAPVWRVSVAPASGSDFVATLRENCEADAFYDWSGGLVWLSMPDGDAHAAEVRFAVSQVGGGHATLVRADAATRANLAVFEPQGAALAALGHRLKAQFDPVGILNPGRMLAGA
ncbi:glycolate oxidase FAD binding subunit [Breoghania corrubedonensis]|uniref:Glycolate oxidase FAD binding subunit n=1 Tax=Breoghania corrubedonensis TaxID=665038 RepID=A0A2T5VF46_9HYPH|nr:glycolate oxidase subunit GlcE [Breoghania corrubedonensis]PTW62360.1 glycolate oxidase FAD binding subunit [Breoghania corrubedonensis]